MKKNYQKNEKYAEIKSDQVTIERELVDKTINDIKMIHFLGSSNKGIDKTGGLSGYYTNIEKDIVNQYTQNGGGALLLTAAAPIYAGIGNCGDLSAILKVKLFSNPSLTEEQKKLVEWRYYFTKDEHQVNSYIKIGNTIYDIWAEKTYDIKRLKAETHVAERNHKLSTGPKSQAYITMPTLLFTRLFEAHIEKFGKSFEAALSLDRRENNIYPTLDINDPSNFALLVGQAFPHLYEKFMETMTDPYFAKHTTIAEDVRNKIIKNFIFLIEELRQDFPLAEKVAKKHPGRKKVSEHDASDAIYQLVPNKLLAAYILAISYKNSNLPKCLNLLSDIKSSLLNIQSDALECWIHNEIASMHPPELTVEPTAKLTETINRGEHPIYQPAISNVDATNNTLSKAEQITNIPIIKN